MVKALHRAGIEVILDVVFNHTAEGDQRRSDAVLPRARQPRLLHPRRTTRPATRTYTGCGNTLNANHPIVRRMIVDSLRYWVEHMHVDGFRFDLASILSRDPSGHADAQSAGAVGHRIGSRARRHEADRRSLGRGRSLSGRQLRRRRLEGMERPLPRRRAQLLPRRRGHGAASGRSDCWAARTSTATSSAKPKQSINFVTCHDGFTLNDLVSYNDKHNEANGEHNRDGADDNRSWNCGVEGPTDDPAIEQLRNRQVKNCSRSRCSRSACR